MILFLIAISVLSLRALAPQESIKKFSSFLGPQHLLTKEEEDAFIQAIKDGNLNDVKRMLKESSQYLDVKDTLNGYLPLHLAVFYENEKIVKFLIEEVDIYYDLQDKKGMTPLMIAVQNNKFSTIISYLLNKGADIHLLNRNVESAGYLSRLRRVGSELIEDCQYQTLQLNSLIVQGKKEDVEELIKKYPACVNRQHENSMTPLQEAIKAGHLEIAEILVKAGAQIDHINNHKETALAIAVQNRNVEAAKWLLERGANVESKDKREMTILYKALFGVSRDAWMVQEFKGTSKDHSVNVEMIDLLIKYKVNLNAPVITSPSCLMWAIDKEYPQKIIHLLIEKGASMEIEGADGKTHSALLIEISRAVHRRSKNPYELVHFIVQKGANLEVKGHNNRTPLMTAIKNERIELVRILLEGGASIKGEDLERKTVFSWAIEKENSQVISMLLEKGFIQKARGVNEFFLEFDQLIKQGNLERVEEIVREIPEITRVRLEGTQPIWQIALEEKKFEVLDFLLSQGASLESLNQEGQGVLMMYLKKGEVEVVKYLLQRGVNASQVNEKGQSVLEIAQEQGNQELVSLFQVYMQKEKEKQIRMKKIEQKAIEFHQLIEEGKIDKIKEKIEDDDEGEELFRYVNIQDKDGNTPLHRAIMEQKIEIVEFFLQYKIRINQKNKKGLTPLALLVMTESFMTVQLIDKLIEKGANVNAKIEVKLNRKELIRVNPQGKNLGSQVSLASYLMLASTVQEKDISDALYLIFNQMKVNQMSRKDMEIMGRRFFDLIQEKKIGGIKKYLKRSQNFLNLIDSQGRTVLMQVVEAEGVQRKRMRFLLQEEVNREEKEEDELEKEGTQEDLMKFLLHQEVDIEAKGRDEYEGQTVLIQAIKRRNYSIANILIEEGSAECDVVDKDKNTPLFYEIDNRSKAGLIYSEEIERTLELLLERNVDVNKEGQRYLHQAIEVEEYNTAKKLIELGIDLKKVDENSRSALQCIVDARHDNEVENRKRIELIKLLLEKEDTTYIQDYALNTALHIAVEQKDIQVINLILEKNSRCMYLANKREVTPLEKSLESESTFLLKALLHHETKPDEELYIKMLSDLARKGWKKPFMVLIERYQPERDILMEILSGSRYEIGTLILSLLPPQLKLPEASFYGTNFLLELFENSDAFDGFQKCLALPVSDRNFFNQQIAPRFLKKYFPSFPLGVKEKEALLSLLAKALTTPLEPESEEILINIHQVRNADKESTPDYQNKFELNIHIFSNFFSAFDFEERKVLLTEFVKNYKKEYKALLGNLDKVPSYYYALFQSVSNSNDSPQEVERIIQNELKKPGKSPYFKSKIVEHWLQMDAPLYLSFASQEESCRKAFTKFLKEGSIRIFKQYIEENAVEFKKDFIDNLKSYLTLRDLKQGWRESKSREKFSLMNERLTEFIVQVILSFSDDPEIISAVIDHMHYFQPHQQADILKVIFDVNPELVKEKSYPRLMSSISADQLLRNKIKIQMRKNISHLRSSFISNPQHYMVKNSDFMDIFVHLCLQEESQDNEKVIQLILENIQNMTGRLSLVIKKIMAHKFDLIQSKYDSDIVEVYLSDQTAWPEQINQVLERYTQSISILSELQSKEEKVLYLSLKTKKKFRLQGISFSFEQACSALSCWVKNNQGQILNENVFFSYEEREHLKILRTFMDKVGRHSKDEHFENQLRKIGLEPTQKIEGSQLSNEELYKKFIYPWAIVLYMRGFDFNSDYKYEQPEYAKQKMESYQQETPCWEVCAWVNTKHPGLGEVFLKYFQPIWNQEDHPLFASMKKVSSLYFIELQHDKNLQEQLVELLKGFQERENQASMAIEGFFEKKRDDLNMDYFIRFIVQKIKGNSKVESALKKLSESQFNLEAYQTFFELPLFEEIKTKYPHFFDQLSQTQEYQKKLVKALTSSQEEGGLNQQEFNHFLEQNKSDVPFESFAFSLFWKFYSQPEVARLFKQPVDLEKDEEICRYLLNLPAFEELKIIAPALFDQLSHSQDLQKQLISILRGFQKQEVENEQELQKFIDTCAQQTDQNLPIEFLLWVTYNYPDQYSFFKEFFESNKDHQACQLFLMNDLNIVLMLCEQDLVRHKFRSIFEPLSKLSVLSDEERQKALDDLNEFLLSSCDLTYNQEAYQKWFSQQQGQVKKIEKGAVCLYYLKYLNPAPEDEYLESQKWKHRLLRRKISHTDSILKDKESQWYEHTEQVFSDIEKHLTFESKESREKHMKTLPHIVGRLGNCASQTQNFMVTVKVLFQNKPIEFEDLKEAFFEASMNYRSEIVEKSAIELVHNERESVHSGNFSRRVALKRRWGIPEASEEDITYSEDHFAPKNEGIIERFFDKKYRFDRVFFEKILKRSCPGQFFGESFIGNVPPYALAFNNQDDTEIWDDAMDIFCVESMIKSLESIQLIQKKEKKQEPYSEELLELPSEIPLESKENKASSLEEPPIFSQKVSIKKEERAPKWTILQKRRMVFGNKKVKRSA